MRNPELARVEKQIADADAHINDALKALAWAQTRRLDLVRYRAQLVKRELAQGELAPGELAQGEPAPIK